MLTELPFFPDTGVYSRRFDFSQLFDSEELKRGVKYKLINHSKSTSMIGILDETGRTTRVFGNDEDEIEAVIMGHDNSEELIMYEIQSDSSTQSMDDLACCGCEADEDGDEADQVDGMSSDDDLEEDYNAFGN